MFAQCGEVRGGGIALMIGETVKRILFVQLQHQFVARGLRQDRRGGDRRDLAVTLHDGLAGNTGLRAIQAIHQHLLRLYLQRQHGAAHRQQGGLQDVEPVDLVHFGVGHRPCQRAFADERGKPVALFFGKFLGIGQPCDGVARVKDHRRRAHRPGQGAAPCLVHATDQDLYSRHNPSQPPLVRGGVHPADMAGWPRQLSARCFDAMFGAVR